MPSTPENGLKPSKSLAFRATLVALRQEDPPVWPGTQVPQPRGASAPLPPSASAGCAEGPPKAELGPRKSSRAMEGVETCGLGFLAGGCLSCWFWRGSIWQIQKRGSGNHILKGVLLCSCSGFSPGSRVQLEPLIRHYVASQASFSSDFQWRSSSQSMISRP